MTAVAITPALLPNLIIESKFPYVAERRQRVTSTVVEDTFRPTVSKIKTQFRTIQTVFTILPCADTRMAG